MNAVSMRVLTVGTVCAAATLLVACTSSGTSSTASPTPTARVTARPTTLTPAVPSIFASGTNACGNPYAINATNADETVPLLDCLGQAESGQTPPKIAVQVGGQVLISGVPKQSSLTYDQRRLRRSGDTFTALRTGNAVVTIHHYNCGPTGSMTTCPLVAVAVG